MRMCPWNITHAPTTSKYSVHKITLEPGRNNSNLSKAAVCKLDLQHHFLSCWSPLPAFSSISPHRLSPKPDTRVSWSSDPVLSHLHNLMPSWAPRGVPSAPTNQWHFQIICCWTAAAVTGTVANCRTREDGSNCKHSRQQKFQKADPVMKIQGIMSQRQLGRIISLRNKEVIQWVDMEFGPQDACKRRGLKTTGGWDKSILFSISSRMEKKKKSFSAAIFHYWEEKTNKTNHQQQKTPSHHTPKKCRRSEKNISIQGLLKHPFLQTEV